jgi:hypothetical protein
MHQSLSSQHVSDILAKLIDRDLHIAIALPGVRMPLIQIRRGGQFDSCYVARVSYRR